MNRQAVEKQPKGTIKCKNKRTMNGCLLNLTDI